MKRRKLAVPDQLANNSFTGYRANLLVVISLVAKENRYFPGISLDEGRRILRVVFSGRCHVHVDNRVRSRVYEEGDFQLLNPQFRSFRVVLRGGTAVKPGGIDADDTVGREKRD